MSSLFSQRPKAIMFDFGGVLATANRQVIMDFFKETLQLSEEQLPNFLHSFKKHRQQGLDEDSFWALYANKSAISLPDDWKERLKRAKSASIQIDPKMVELVEDLKAQGYLVGILSNVKIHEATVVKQTGIYKFFDPVILSCNIGVEKPNSKAYSIMLNKISIPAEECIFIDDKCENVDAANKMNIDSIIFSSKKNLIEELAKRNIFPLKKSD